MHRGFIKIWRKISDWAFADDLITKVIWYELLLLVTHKDINMWGVTIKRGSYLTTYTELGKKAGRYGKGGKYVTKEQVRRSLNALEEAGQVTTQKTRNRLLITVLNYDDHQDKEKTKEMTKPTPKPTQNTHEKHTEHTPIEQEQEEQEEYNTTSQNEVVEKALKKTKPKKEPRTYDQDSQEMQLSILLSSLMQKNNAKVKLPNNFNSWCNDFRLAMQQDKRSFEDIKLVIEFSQNDSFWKTNILSASKLRKQFDQLYLKAKTDKEKQNNATNGRYNQSNIGSNATGSTGETEFKPRFSTVAGSTSKTG